MHVKAASPGETEAEGGRWQEEATGLSSSPGLCPEESSLPSHSGNAPFDRNCKATFTGTEEVAAHVERRCFPSSRRWRGSAKALGYGCLWNGLHGGCSGTWTRALFTATSVELSNALSPFTKPGFQAAASPSFSIGTQSTPPRTRRYLASLPRDDKAHGFHRGQR